MKATKLISVALLAAAVGACATEADTGAPPIVDQFEVEGRSLEVVATPVYDGSFDVELRYATGVESYGASFNLGAADLGQNEDLVALLSHVDASLLAHVNETLVARDVPRSPTLQRWSALEQGLFGYLDLDAERAYAIGNWEYCEVTGSNHYCVFDHGCSWLCHTLGYLLP